MAVWTGTSVVGVRGGVLPALLRFCWYAAACTCKTRYYVLDKSQAVHKPTRLRLLTFSSRRIHNNRDVNSGQKPEDRLLCQHPLQCNNYRRKIGQIPCQLEWP